MGREQSLYFLYMVTGCPAWHFLHTVTGWHKQVMRGQVLWQVPLIRPLAAIRLLRSQVGQSPEAQCPFLVQQRSAGFHHVHWALGISSRVSLNDSSLLEGLGILLACLLSLNGWKTTLQAVLRDMTSFQTFSHPSWLFSEVTCSLELSGVWLRVKRALSSES